VLVGLAFARQAEPLPGNGEAVAVQRLSLPGEFSYRSTPRRKRHRNCSVCAVMYLGSMRTVWGRWAAGAGA